MDPNDLTSPISKKVLWTGRVISALPVLLLLFSSSLKFVKTADVVEEFARLGYPESLILPIGLLELACTIMYLIPRTSILGAILLAAYLGGATATLARIGDPFYMPALVGILVWVGLYLREERLHTLVPLRRPSLKRLAGKWTALAVAPLAWIIGPAGAQGDAVLREQATDAMARATAFFRTKVATNGGYLWRYSTDFSMRQGEERAFETTIWVQPPGTPEIGMTWLDAFEATGDPTYLEAATDAARALVWGQLASGGWDYRIDFDPERARAWYYRRDVRAGNLERGSRRNTSVFDDDTSQSALRLLMRVDKALAFGDGAIHDAALFSLQSFLKAQFPNGAWPQRYDRFPSPEQFPVVRARYPQDWSWEWPNLDYRDFYTFNDNAMADVMEVMIEAFHTYGEAAYRDAAIRCGDFMRLAQMPEPQPSWAQQYNHQMEPAWARRFEPPAITGGESFGVMRALIDLFVETGEARFLEPIPPALAWSKKVRLPDGRMARFYELKTDRPLYFVRDSYALTYSDHDLPTHYAFKVSGDPIERTEAYLARVKKEGREAILAERRMKWQGTISDKDRAQVREIIARLDEQGRWIERGWLLGPEPGQRVETDTISSRTFSQNLHTLARFAALAGRP